MIQRLAIVFGGLILAGVCLNVFYLVFCGVVVFVLGIDNELLLNVGYWTCFVTGVITSICLLRPAWPKSAPKDRSDQPSP